MLQKIAEKLRTEQVQYAGHTYYRNIYPLVTDKQKEEYASSLKKGQSLSGGITGGVLGGLAGTLIGIGSDKKGSPATALAGAAVGTLAGTVIGGVTGYFSGRTNAKRSVAAGLGYSDHYDPIDAKESMDLFKKIPKK